MEKKIQLRISLLQMRKKITTQKHWYESVFLPYIATKYYDRKVIYEYCIQDLDTDWGGPSVRSRIL